jgi:NAD-dependent SIR2 family protein deacetylase
MEQSVFRLLQSGRGIIFSGAGMSVAAGLDIFSTLSNDEVPKSKSSGKKHKEQNYQRRKSLSKIEKQGWYSQAAKRLGLKDGMEAFRFRYLNNFPRQSFYLLECLYWQVVGSNVSPTLAHQIVNRMGDRVVRHYTLNIDGLATGTKSSSTTTIRNATDATTPAAKVIELHGNLHELVCRSCGNVYPTNTILDPSRCKCLDNDAIRPNTAAAGATATAGDIFPPPPTCPNKDCNGELCFRILLYEDLESHLIFGNNASSLESLLPNDLAVAQWIIWVGVSFRQQASCEYFDKMLQLGATCPIVIVDPRAKDVLEDLETVVGTLQGFTCYPMAMTSDEFFQKLETFPK